MVFLSYYLVPLISPLKKAPHAPRVDLSGRAQPLRVGTIVKYWPQRCGPSPLRCPQEGDADWSRRARSVWHGWRRAPLGVATGGQAPDKPWFIFTFSALVPWRAVALPTQAEGQGLGHAEGSPGPSRVVGL